MIYQWPSPGKLNLFLYITGRSDNGYHLLQTLFQFIDYGDNIKIIPTKNGMVRLFNLKGHLIINHNNLIIKAAQLLRYYCAVNNETLGADIFINKILPVGSGLGSISSNAATILLVLNQQWKCYLSKNVLMRLGLMLGADVPVFIFGHSSFAQGIGEVLIPMFLPKKWYLIIMPPVHVSTAFVFNAYKKLGCLYSPYRSIQELLSVPFYNDLEKIVKKLFPMVQIYCAQLSKYASVRLTGTGSCIFSEFNTESLAYHVQNYLPLWVRSIVVQGLNVSPLHQKLEKLI